MSLDKAQVEAIAELAQLGLTPGEIEELRGELASILEFVAQMSTAELSGITPMAHSNETATPLRPDSVDAVVKRELFQENAPQVQDGLYLVPKVVD